MCNLPSGRKWNELDSWIWELGFSWTGSRELDLPCERMNELERNGLGLLRRHELDFFLFKMEFHWIDKTNMSA